MSNSVHFVNVINTKGATGFLASFPCIPRVGDDIAVFAGPPLKVRRVILKQGRQYPDVLCYDDPALGMDICN